MSYGPSVPAEFIGRARAFRARVGAEDAAVGQTILKIMRPLERRRKRSATFRPEQLIDAERQFRQLPSAGRLALKIERDKRSLRIEEFRVAAGQFRFCSWTDGATDADIGVVKVNLSAVPWGPVGATGNIVASVSLHALARRFQRGFNTSDEAILSELRELAVRHVAIAAALADFSVACDGGSWVGEVAKIDVAEVSCPVLAIRTFTPAGAPTREAHFG